VTSSADSSPQVYEIRISGHLDARWLAWFDGLTLTHDRDGTSVIRGVLVDQAALHGVLQKLRDTGLPLISVTHVDIHKEHVMATSANHPLTNNRPSTPEKAAPTIMKAAVYRRFGGPEVVQIETVATPRPGAGEILIQVKATTVSAADHRTRARDVPAGLILPSSLVLGFFRPRRPILGMDVAGVVVEVGDGVDEFAPGDEVLAMLGSRFGGHAEYAIARTSDAIALKPRAMGFDEAASLVFGGITAQAYLRQVTIGAGTTVLVNGASGAVGTAVVQLAKAAGAHVTGVSSSSNAAFVSALGADRMIDYATHDFAADGSRYDVIVDCVGNAPVGRVLGSLNPGGAVLLVAANLRSLVSAPRLARRHDITVIAGPGPYRAEDLAHVVDLAERGAVRPTIERTFPLKSIAAAHAFVDRGRKRGSVVVTVEHATAGAK
jgi:NADPH:quinone reductase-like Zn-dependent oxidoreductase